MGGGTANGNAKLTSETPSGPAQLQLGGAPVFVCVWMYVL